MARRINQKNISFSSDKAIYDAVKQKKVTNEHVRTMFLDRGILISSESERDDLALYFSSLNHDFHDHVRLAEILSTTNRKDRNSFFVIDSPITEDAVLNALHAVKKIRKEKGDKCTIHQKSKKIEFEVTYEKLDYNKSEFKQVINRVSIFEFDFSNEVTVVRYSFKDHMSEVKDAILDSLSEKTQADLDYTEIELPSSISPKDKSKFFRLLIDNIAGMTVTDVSDVYTFNPNMPDEEIDTHIEKAALNGESVLGSEQFDELSKKEFYVSKIVWKATHKDKIGTALYEFEAQFSNERECKDFTYLVRGKYRASSKEDGTFNKSKVQLDRLDSTIQNKNIETAVLQALVSIGRR